MTSILYLQRESQPSIGQKREIRRARRRWALIKMTRIPVVSLQVEIADLGLSFDFKDRKPIYITIRYHFGFFVKKLLNENNKRRHTVLE